MLLLFKSAYVYVCVPSDDDFDNPVRTFDEDESFLTGAVESRAVNVHQFIPHSQLLTLSCLSSLFYL